MIYVHVHAGVLLEAGTRVPAPVYSEHSTRLRRNEVSSRQILKSKARLTETSFHRFPALNYSCFLREN